MDQAWKIKDSWVCTRSRINDFLAHILNKQHARALIFSGIAISQTREADPDMMKEREYTHAERMFTQKP